MKKVNFNKIHDERKSFLKENADFDHIVINGQNKVLISAPHGVSQIRLGRLKFKEPGSLATALYLRECSKSFFIAKTKNNNDDANFDEDCEYRKTIENIIENFGIKYLIDFHGLASKRDCDINLGIHLGKNIECNVDVYDKLKYDLEKNNFIVFVDKPYMAGSRTISGAMKNKYPNLWTIQIEINCAITNKKENVKKFTALLNVLEEWLEFLN